MASKSKSSSQQQRTRKHGLALSPSGPLKATQSFGLTSKGCDATLGVGRQPPSRSFESNGLSGTSQGRDGRRSSSPDSPSFLRKVRKGSSLNSLLPRSSSFDAISSNYYLNGTWPRTGLVRTPLSGTTNDLTISDKETQTPTEWTTDQSAVRPATVAHIRSSSLGTAHDDLKEIRARLKTTIKESNGTRCSPQYPLVVGRSSPSVSLLQSALQSKTASGRRRRKGQHSTVSHTRGSLEGLNQELEKLELSISSNEFNKHDGRRAPVADLLTLDTDIDANQPVTPADHATVSDSNTLATEPVSIPEPGDSGSSPMTAAVTFDSGSEPAGDLPDKVDCKTIDGYSQSPPKVILTRLPPDGCESIVCKVNEDSNELPSSNCEVIPVKPVVMKCHIPSESSAFCAPLYKKYIGQPVDLLTTLLAQTTLNAEDKQ